MGREKALMELNWKCQASPLAIGLATQWDENPHSVPSVNSSVCPTGLIFTPHWEQPFSWHMDPTAQQKALRNMEVAIKQK